VVVAVTGVWAGVSGGSTASRDPVLNGPTATQQPLPDRLEIEEVKTKDIGDRFTAEDGTVYKRVSLSKLVWPEQTTVAVTVTRGDKPLAAVLQCNGKSDVMVDLYYPDERNVDALGMGNTCGVAPDPIELSSLRKGQRTTLSMNASDTVDGGQTPTGSATWTTSIYEWTPPAKPAKAPKMPKLLKAGQLLKSTGGIWPDTKTLTLTVPYRGNQLFFAMQCTGAISDHARLDSTLNGKPVELGFTDAFSNTSNCDSTSDNMQGSNKLSVPEGTKQVTLTVRLAGLDPAYHNRTSSWTIGLFEK
jgi:hypothetical protein